MFNKQGRAAIEVDGKSYTSADIHKLVVQLKDCQGRRQKVTGQLLEVLKQFVLPNLELMPRTAELVSRLYGTNAIEAAYILSSLQESLNATKGDVCEFGVAQGRTSAVLGYAILNTDRALWLYDSFEGLPPPHRKDVMIDDIFNLGDIQAYEGTMSCPRDLVAQEIKAIGLPNERTHIIEGWVEDTISKGQLPDRVCFAYLDCDFYSPTLTALVALNERMQGGATIVLDDYGHFSSGVETATQEFLESHPGIFSLHCPIDGAGSFRLLKKN